VTTTATTTAAVTARRTALVTGASGGIGLEFARRFAKEGYNVVLVARSKDQLEVLAAQLTDQFGVRAVAIAADLAQDSAPQAVYDQLTAMNLHIDVLVNNAGLPDYGLFHLADTNKQMQMIHLNIGALTHLTRLVLPGMIERGYGRVINIASTAAFMAGPLMSVYYASKAYVLSFSDAIANELEGTGVKVSVLAPGPVASGFQARAGMEKSRLVQQGLMSAQELIDQVFTPLMEGKPLVIPGLRNKVIPILARLLSRGAAARLTRAAQERVDH
jgi:short-subunit dehydrogenase